MSSRPPLSRSELAINAFVDDCQVGRHDTRLVIQDRSIKESHSYPMITCKVIAAIRDSSDIEAVDVQED
jgi:hypothetical protein